MATTLDSPQSPLQHQAPAGDPLERGRLRVVVATIILNVAVVSLLTLASWSDWRTGVALNFVDNALLLWFVIRHRDGLLGRLMLFGLAVGFAELPADAWLVDHTKTLSYATGGGPVLWRSPLWMPFAWEIVAVQFGYVGLRLRERFGGLGLLLNGVLGAINIPFYEEMARRIHWWTYSNCRMISGTPYYIILGEFGIAIALAILASPLRRGTRVTAIVAGLGAGAAILFCYATAFWITDGLFRK